MKTHIISIFPESFESYLNSSIIGRAKDKGLFEPIFYKLNDFSEKKFKHVDAKAYGMHGQVISPEPLKKAIEHVFEIVGKKLPVVYLSPKGDLLNQEKSEGLYNKLGNEFIIICGHYEGIDQRIIDIYVDYEISIGEYVISSGELASTVLLDCLIRQIPHVLGNNKSLEEDSFGAFFNRQKEHPVYTRPEKFMGKNVPKILLSGNHKEIENWKKTNLS